MTSEVREAIEKNPVLSAALQQAKESLEMEELRKQRDAPREDSRDVFGFSDMTQQPPSGMNGAEAFYQDATPNDYDVEASNRADVPRLALGELGPSAPPAAQALFSHREYQSVLQLRPMRGVDYRDRQQGQQRNGNPGQGQQRAFDKSFLSPRWNNEANYLKKIGLPPPSARLSPRIIARSTGAGRIRQDRLLKEDLGDYTPSTTATPGTGTQFIAAPGSSSASSSSFQSRAAPGTGTQGQGRNVSSSSGDDKALASSDA